MSVSVLTYGSIALALGLRHGLDADHLAAIDALTRFNITARRRFAPWCGALFAAGHCAAIFLAAALLSALAASWTAPAWLTSTGKYISAAMLLILAAFNLHQLNATSQTQIVGARTRLFASVLRSSSPWQIVLVGVLFALSFDALGLAALFAANATSLGFASLAGALALTFALGMVAVDAINGWWIAQLAARSDRAGAASSRAMTLSVALVSLTLGAAIILSCLLPGFDTWLALHELSVSALVASILLSSYIVARLMALGSLRDAVALQTQSSS